jgi:hypothetical protein
MNTGEKVVEVGAPRARGLVRWLVLVVLVVLGSALAGWTWWLFA